MAPLLLMHIASVLAMSRRRRAVKESPLEAAAKATAGFVLVGVFLVWGTFFQQRPADSAGAIQDVVARVYAPLAPLAFAGLALTGLLLIWMWRRAIDDHRATHRAFETRAQLAALSPEQFERWCGSRLEAMGCRVKNVAGSGDHGVDLIAEKDDVATVVQCKRYAGARQVGEPQVRDLFGAMHHHGAARAMVITAGTFTDQARSWSVGKPIDLWDVDRLAALGSAAPGPRPIPVSVMPNCERCGSPMKLRRNRVTRVSFYGCSTYPRCRFTRPLVS